MARHPDHPGVWGEQGAENSQGRSLSGAIRTEQAIETTPGNVQREVVQGLNQGRLAASGEALPEMVELNQAELLQRGKEGGNLGSTGHGQLEENRHPAPVEARRLGGAAEQEKKADAEEIEDRPTKKVAR